MKKSAEEKEKTFKYPPSFLPLLPRNPNGNGSLTVSRWKSNGLLPAVRKIRWDYSHDFRTFGPLVHTGVRGLYSGSTVRIIIP